MLIGQMAGRTWLPIDVGAQATTPYLLPPAAAGAVVAGVLGAFALAVACAIVAVAVAALMAPVVFRSPSPAPAPDGAHLTVAHANVYIDNERPADAARTLFALDADVLAVTEYITGVRNELIALGIERTHPHRVEAVSGDRDGIALYSRFPMEARTVHFGHQPGIDATIRREGSAIRVMVVHPVPGTNRAWLRRWRSDMGSIGLAAASGGRPTMVVGDFNASRWHPCFRRLLDTGLVDAHEQVGRGLSVSWPELSIAPAFVRLDHALVNEALVATAVADVIVPGSDHRGFMVTVATT